MFRTATLSAAILLVVSSAVVRADVLDVDRSTPVRYDGHRLVRVDDPADWPTMIQLGAETHTCRGLGPYFRVPPGVQPLVDAAGIPFELIHADLQVRIDEERARLNAVAGAGNFFDDFRTYEEINAQIDLYAQQRPDLVEKITVGTSWQGRTIYGMKITGPGGGERPAVLINGCQHAREWLAAAVNMYVADALINGYDTDPLIQARLDATELYVVPLVNPDGYVYTWTTDRYQRKNRHDYDGQCVGRLVGVDLNRNWPVDWNGGESTSMNTCSDVYVGPAPLSEPESTAMFDFVLARPNIALHIDFHTFAQVILQPWAYTNVLPPDFLIIDGLGAAMSQAMFEVNGRNWPHGSGDDLLYLASGVFPDWTTSEGIYGYTIELVGSDFVVPASEIVPTGEEGLAATLTLLQAVAAGVIFTFPEGQPTIVEADVPFTMAVDIAPVASGAVDTASGQLFCRVGTDGPFAASPLAHLGGTLYEATLPAVPCGEMLQYYFEIDNLAGLTFSGPFDAPAELYEAQAFNVLLAFADDFESDQGWSVVNDGGLTDGGWDRGVPVNCDRGDPPADADGSGQCYLTDNSSANQCNSDVDGGATSLLSPLLDATDPDAAVSYWRWYDNSAGGSPLSDVFVVEASDDGGASWTILETVGPGGSEAMGGWYRAEFRIADVPGISNTDQLVLRFTASDLGAGSVVEAAVDNVRVSSVFCDTPLVCETDLTGPAGMPDGNVDSLDFLVLIGQWGSPCAGSCTADVTGPGGAPDGNVDSLDFLLLISQWGSPANCGGP